VKVAGQQIAGDPTAAAGECPEHGWHGLRIAVFNRGSEPAGKTIKTLYVCIHEATGQIHMTRADQDMDAGRILDRLNELEAKEALT
jgi:hypothetical protein